MRNPFRAGNYKSDSESLGRSDTQNGVYYFHSALLGLSRFSSAVRCLPSEEILSLQKVYE